MKRFNLADGFWIVLLPPSHAQRIRNTFNPAAQARLPGAFAEIFGRWPSVN